MNSTYLGNFIIDESNVEQYDNNYYRLKHMDTLLLMRDKGIIHILEISL